MISLFVFKYQPVGGIWCAVGYIILPCKKRKLKSLRNSSGEVKTGEKIQGTSGVEGEACLWGFTLQQWGPDPVPPSAIEICRHQCLTSPQASFPPPPQVIFFFTFCKMIHPCPRGYCCETGVAVFLQNWSYGEAWPSQTDQSRGGHPDLHLSCQKLQRPVQNWNPQDLHLLFSTRLLIW